MKLEVFIKCLLDGHQGKIACLYNVSTWHTATGEVLTYHINLEKMKDMLPMLSYFNVISFEFDDNYGINIEIEPNYNA